MLSGIIPYDVVSGSDITPCKKMDKSLVVYRLVALRYDSQLQCCIKDCNNT